jgi:ribonuclease HI
MKVNVNWLYEIKKTKRTVSCQSELLQVSDALDLYEELEGNSKVKSIEVIDGDGYKLMKKDLKKYISTIDEEPHNIEAYFDGGYDETKNLGSAGVVIYYEKAKKRYRIRENELIPYIDSNNEAEYAAFWNMLTAIDGLGVRSISVTFKGDSLVVLKQLEGEWSCHDQQLNNWLDRIEAKMKELKIKPIFEPITRKENKEADKLASQALNDIKIKSVVELNKE